jgi:hypothetical protein
MIPQRHPATMRLRIRCGCRWHALCQVVLSLRPCSWPAWHGYSTLECSRGMAQQLVIWHVIDLLSYSVRYLGGPFDCNVEP